jgi:dTDP-glucose 4,6-dehydratase
VLERGRVGETYNIGGRAEMMNIDVVQTICGVLQELRPAPRPYKHLIAHVEDRPGHDRRYAIAPDRIERELGWRPTATFADGIRRTVQWYLDNNGWVSRVKTGVYRDWLDQHYGKAPAQWQPAQRI